MCGDRQKVTFPADIVRVTVVNNSAEPNEKEGNKYKDISGKEYTLVVPHDSTTYRLAEYIALELSDAHYFPEITIFYDDSITLPKKFVSSFVGKSTFDCKGRSR